MMTMMKIIDLILNQYYRFYFELKKWKKIETKGNSHERFIN